MLPPAVIQKHVVLLGAGNAHLVFARMSAMRPLPGVAVTLVSEDGRIPYSAMVPGHLGGDYARDEITIDLVRFCKSANVRFLAARAVGVDPVSRVVRFADRGELSYDVLSLGIGSLPAMPPGIERGPDVFALRPLSALIDGIDALHARLTAAPRPYRLAVVGGGASGCELTLALRKRFANVPGFSLVVVHHGERLLPTLPAKLGETFAGIFRERGIDLKLNTSAVHATPAGLELSDGSALSCDGVLWATNAAPQPLPGIERLCDGGFLRVDDHLRSPDEPAIFGTGDCIRHLSKPDLPKNGVHAVRQGRVLFANVPLALREKPLTTYAPQATTLFLLNTADGRAGVAWGAMTMRNRPARWLKDRIDRAWVAKFAPLPAMSSPAETSELDPGMKCGGCGSKISGDVLSAVLRRLDTGDDPRVVMGVKAGEDAAAHRMNPALYGDRPENVIEVQTVDHFRAFVDDPYLFGKVAALHSLSDLYAMNARPFTAMAIATLPYARGPVQEGMLHELLSGALAVFRDLGVTLVGGHTTEGAELALGFAVTGHADETRVFRKGGLSVGDKLILTKPIGSGAILAAWMRAECRAEWFAELAAGITLANDRAATIFAEAGVTGCTDVTGFGLAGHLLEMLDASRLSATVDVAAIPTYAGFAEVTGKNIVSSLHADNAKLACRVVGSSAPVLFDPQTSGGLLAGVAADHVGGVLERLRAAGHHRAAVIGEVTHGGSGPTVTARTG